MNPAINPVIVRFLLVVAAFFGLAALAIDAAAAKDVAGGRDHPLVGRYDGASMTLYKARDYEESRIATRAIASADLRVQKGRRLGDANSAAVAGKSTRIRYEIPAGRSSLEVARNHRDRLAAQGFTIVFECRTRTCSDNGGGELYFALHDENPLGTGDVHSSPATQTLTTARLPRPTGDVWVSIYTAELPGGAVEALVDVVETRPMEADKIVFVDAGAMARAIDAGGRVSLHGIRFDFDQATIHPESQPTLDEIVKFLKSAPNRRVVVAGHTDGQGGFDYNLDLSARRARAVVEALSKAGIAPSRLQPFGAGMAAPIASNATEAGRAENRRVELVEMR